MEVLKQLWENKHFGGSIFEPVKSAGMPSIVRQGASAPIKNAGLHDRANGLLAGFRSGGWDPQYKFLTLKGVQVSRSQGASGKLVDIQILCTDIVALKQNKSTIRELKTGNAAVYLENVKPFLTGYARVLCYTAEGPKLKLSKVISLTEG